LQDTQLGEELTKKEACGSTMGRHTFAYDATYRRAVWLPRGQLRSCEFALSAFAK